MAVSRFSSVVAAIAASTLCFSTSAFAASAVPVAAPAAVSSMQISPWVALSALSSAPSAAALCGANAAAAVAGAAAQGAAPGCVLPVTDAPPAPVASNGPPAPIPVPEAEVGGGFGISPLFLGLGALALGGLIYLLVHKNKKNSNSPA